MHLRRPQAFAGLLIVGLLALVGFAAFSATGVGDAPPVDIPANVSARVAGGILGIELGPAPADQELAPAPEASPEPATTAPPTTTSPTLTAAPDRISSSTTTAAPPPEYPPGIVGGTRDVEE